MSEKWTPGPWHSRRALNRVDGQYDYAISGKDAPVIAEAFGRSADGAWPPAEANARLISAAPDFAGTAARAQVLANSRGGDYGDLTQSELCEFMVELDAALAKARGEA